MKLSKTEREELRMMFGGRCAYCGKEIGKDFHADHVSPIYRMWITYTRPPKAGEDLKSNLFPACPRCNLWKSVYSVEEFRERISHQTFQLTRDSANYRMAKDFGLISENENPIVFWFEKYKDSLYFCKGEGRYCSRRRNRRGTSIMTATLCPFASRCWMGGNYVFCKTATCKEPLIERAAVSKPVTEEPPEEHDNGGDGMEQNTGIQSIQGVLF